MSRLTDKIKRTEDQISDLQCHLDALYDKQSRSTYKRRRKQYRKKYVSDITYRMTQRMLKSLERDLYGS